MLRLAPRDTRKVEQVDGSLTFSGPEKRRGEGTESLDQRMFLTEAIAGSTKATRNRADEIARVYRRRRISILQDIAWRQVSHMSVSELSRPGTFLRRSVRSDRALAVSDNQTSQ